MTDEPRKCKRCQFPLAEDAHSNRKYHEDCFTLQRQERWTTGGVETHTTNTRRCRNRDCIERFVPVNAQNWYHENACRDAPNQWSVEQILQEEGAVPSGSSGVEMAKAAFAQKNTAVRRNAKLQSMRDYLAISVRTFYDEHPEFLVASVPVPLGEEGGKGEREIIVQLSDWQVGKWEMGFGIEGTLKRVRDVERAVAAMIRRTRDAGYTVNRVHITIGGDMIEGCFIYKSQNVTGLDRTSNTHFLTVQIQTVAHEQAKFIQYVSQLAPEIIVHVVGGNHGRVNGPNDFADPDDNFDVMAARWSQDLTRNLENVTWDISDTWWLGFHSMGHYIVMMHGDQWKGKLETLRTLLPKWITSGVFGARPDVVLVHHRHTGAMEEMSKVLVFQNGTIDGGSEWYLKAYGESSTPQQNVIVMSPEYTPEALWPIRFEGLV
jgi:hypothetical protein